MCIELLCTLVVHYEPRCSGPQNIVENIYDQKSVLFSKVTMLRLLFGGNLE